MELHVGQRVRTGWTGAMHVRGGPDQRDPRMRRGVLEQGPVPAGEVIHRTGGGYIVFAEPAWLVRLHDDGERWWAAESLIFPDDGDADTASTREKERDTA